MAQYAQESSGPCSNCSIRAAVPKQAEHLFDADLRDLAEC